MVGQGRSRVQDDGVTALMMVMLWCGTPAGGGISGGAAAEGRRPRRRGAGEA